MRNSWMLILAAALSAAGAVLSTARSTGAAPAVSAAPPPAAPAPARAPAAAPATTGTEEPFGPDDEAMARQTSSPKPLNDEQLKTVLDYLQAKRPEIYKQVMGYRETDLRRFYRATRSMWNFISRIKSLPEKVGQAYEARQMAYVRMWRLAREFDATKDATVRADLDKQLLEFAQQQFDADQIIREHRLTELAEQITRMKADLAEREKERPNIVREIAERMKKNAAHLTGTPTKAPHTRPAGS
jgi:ribosomal protein L17